MAKLTLNPGMESPQMISQKTKDILTKAADTSKNPVITINSGIRSPHRQAVAMYDNLEAGKRIAYAAPGREVVKVYDDNKEKAKDEVIKWMVAKINELSAKEQRVSLHCVSEADYGKLNIVDVSKNMPNPRDFVKALIMDDAVTRVITPFASVYNSTKVSVDGNEPAIHVEIKQ